MKHKLRVQSMYVNIYVAIGPSLSAVSLRALFFSELIRSTKWGTSVYSFEDESYK